MADKPAPKKKGRPPKLDPELVAAAIAKHNGNISVVAKKFGVQRASVQELIHKRPALQTILADAREGMLDDAESALYKKAQEGEGWAVCFFLKTQGRGRGYLENAVLYEMQREMAELREVMKQYADRAGSQK